MQANSTSLLSIQRLDPIYANFTITESDLPAVQKADGTRHAEGGGPSAIRCRKAQLAPGESSFSTTSVQNGSGTVNLRATMSNADRHFWPGQFVDVKLVLARKKERC